MSTQIDQNIEAGLRWGALRQIVTALVSVLGALAYTRFLRPEDLGAFGLAFIVFSGLVLLIEAPFRDAVVYYQRQDLDYTGAAFWLLVGLGIPIALLVAILAGPLGSFYNSPNAVGLTRILVIAFVFEAAAVVPGALLLKKFRFTTHEILKLVTTLIQLFGWVGLGLAGFGAWALAIPVLASSIFWALSSWLTAGFRPKWVPERAAFAAIIRYSRSIFGSKLLTYFKLNIDNAAVGTLGERSLGLYSFGEDQSAAAVISVSGAVSQVTLPAMASVQEYPREQQRIFLEMLRLTATIATPMQLGMIVLADIGVRVIFGPQWMAGVAVLQAYLTFRLVDTLVKICDAAMSAIGRPDIPFKVDIAQVPFFFVATWLGLQVWGSFLGVAWALSVLRLLAGLIYLGIALRVTRVRIRETLRYLGPSTLAGLLMAASIWWMRGRAAVLELGSGMPNEFLSSAAQLIVMVLVGVGIYALLLAVFDPNGFLDVIRLAWRVVRPQQDRSAIAARIADLPEGAEDD